MNWEMNMEVISQEAVARKVFLWLVAVIYTSSTVLRKKNTVFPLDELTCIIIDLLLLFLMTNLFLFPFVPHGNIELIFVINEHMNIAFEVWVETIPGFSVVYRMVEGEKKTKNSWQLLCGAQRDPPFGPLPRITRRWGKYPVIPPFIC